MQYNKIASVSCMHMTSVSYPRNKRKQAIALLPTLSGKHRARHAFTPIHTEVIIRTYHYKPYETRIEGIKNKTYVAV